MGFLEFYKKGQGSVARLLGLVGIGGLVLWGCWALWVRLQGFIWASSSLLDVPHVGLRIDWALIIAVGVALGGVVGTAWLLNRPKLVDLLVETEAEMKKVSWPSRQEAWNSSIIVVVTVIVLMSLLFVYDLVLNQLLTQLFGA